MAIRVSSPPDPAAGTIRKGVFTGHAVEPFFSGPTGAFSGTGNPCPFRGAAKPENKGLLRNGGNHHPGSQDGLSGPLSRGQR